MRHRLLATAVIGVSVACGTAACGASGGTHAGPAPASTSSKPVSAAAVMLAADTSTTAQKTAKISLAENVSVQGHSIAIKATGDEDFAGHALDLVTTVAGQRFETREVSSRIYERLPATLAGHLPGGKTWLTIDLNSITKSEFGSSLSQLQSSSQSDPADLLAYLRGVSANGAHRVGTATIRGVTTTEYSVTVDLEKALAKVPAAQQRAIKAAMQKLGTSTYPMKIWVDSSNLVRQLSFHIATPVSTTAVTTKVDVTATMQLYDFGTPVHVTAPPASQVFDLTSKVASPVA